MLPEEWINVIVPTLRVSGIILSIYTVICFVAIIVAMWKIFEKEGIKPYFSLIPFLNFYKYYKLCRLPFWTVFIPIINVIVMYASSFVIARNYRCPRWQSYLAIFFPYVILPYIAFSDRKSFDFVHNDIFVKNTYAIDALEEKLIADKSFEYEAPENNGVSKNVQSSNTDLMIDSIENGIQEDEYVYDEVVEFKEQQVEIPTDNHDFIEMDDDVDIDDLSLDSIDELDESIQTESSVEKSIVTDIKDYKEHEKTNEAIAFGGEKQIENVEATKTKNDELKCPRCGSSLVGMVNNTCPGCNMKIA